jgi:hypothetical protein
VQLPQVPPTKTKNMQKIEDLYVAFLQFIIGYTALIVAITIGKIGRNKFFINRLKNKNKKNGKV